MFQSKYFYYIASLCFVGGLYWGIKNSSTLFPNLVERLSRKDSVCVALPKATNTEKLRDVFSKKPFLAEFREYESGADLDNLLFNTDCDIYLFPSKFLPHFADQGKLAKFHQNDLDLSKVSPDFLGLGFDRVNQFYIPLAYWTEQQSDVDKKTLVNILLATSTIYSKNLNVVREVISDLLSVDVQKLFYSENHFGTILRDSEIDIPFKSSAIRKMNLKDVIIVKDEPKEVK